MCLIAKDRELTAPVEGEGWKIMTNDGKGSLAFMYRAWREAPFAPYIIRPPLNQWIKADKEEDNIMTMTEKFREELSTEDLTKVVEDWANCNFQPGVNTYQMGFHIYAEKPEFVPTGCVAVRVLYRGAHSSGVEMIAADNWGQQAAKVIVADEIFIQHEVTEPTPESPIATDANGGV